MHPTSITRNLAAALLAGSAVATVAGCGSDSRKASAALDRAEGERNISGEGGESPLHAPPDNDRRISTSVERDRQIRDDRVSRARAASTREREVEVNTVSFTLPGEDELLLLEARGPVEARPNEPFEYEVDVTNISEGPLVNIEIREHHSENLEFLDTEQRASDDEGRTWSIAHLAPGETETILIEAQAAEAGTSDLCLTASVTPLLCLVTEVVEPVVELTVTGPVEALRCEPIEYIITVRNTGVGAARDVMVIDELPEGLTHEGSQHVEIEVGTLEAGEVRDFPVVVEATSTGEFTNRARVAGDDGAAKDAAFTVVVREPRLEISTNGPARDFIGAPLDYEITVTNVGDAPARDTVLTESLPSGADFESATLDGRQTGNRVTWALGTLNPGESRTVEARIRVNRDGRFTNTAVATAYCAEDVQADATTILTGIAGLLLEVVDTEDPVRIGEETSYEITVTNQGTKDARSVQIKATLDPGMEFIAASGETSHRVTEGREIVFEPVEVLDVGQDATWIVTVRGVSAADSRFNVAMTSTELTEPVNEEESTHVYESD